MVHFLQPKEEEKKWKKSYWEDLDLRLSLKRQNEET
jgi:hypothetical protein